MPNATAHYADVADPDSVDGAVVEIISKHGRIDNLVTSTGFTENFEAILCSRDRMQRLWGVVVDGTYLFAKLVAGLARSWTKTPTFVRSGPLSSLLAVWVHQGTSWDQLRSFSVTRLGISLVPTSVWMVVTP